MIDLSRTRAGFLAEIDAPDPLVDPLSDLVARPTATADAHLRICGHAQGQLFSLLKAVLLERFAMAGRPELIRDLLVPLKNALGNAFKHGNDADVAKAISIEIVLTGKGALIAITDEGRGFDAALTFQRFLGQENYFVNYGAGFRNLHRAMSTVSYENGGRTVLLCFRPTIPEPGHASTYCPASAGGPTVTPGEISLTNLVAPGLHEPTPNPCQEGNSPPLCGLSTLLPGGARGGSDPGKLLSDHAPANILDSEWMRTFLSAELSEFGDGRARLESCRVYATGSRAGGDCGNRYVLRVAGHDGRPAETRILTGRLHATEAAAEADFEAATRLHEVKLSKRVLIPRPVGRLSGKPSLVLYDFDSWMNLWEYSTYHGRLNTLRSIAKRIGRALTRLHRSPIMFPGGEPERAREGLQAMVVRAEKHLQTLPCGPGLVNRFRVAARRMENPAAFGGWRIPVPIHGALGWDCIHYGVDGRFYLYRFETCRQSDPGLDLGGFAADLLCFMLTHHDEEAYHICLDDFLGKYNSEAARPISKDELLPYTALALVERLGRAGSSAKVGAGQWLAALDAALTTRTGGAENEVSA